MLPYLEYIHAVYQEKSFSKAAQKLYVSQPWLSAAVKKAEEDLQMTLFNRNTSPITLTEAGQLYIESAEQIMAIEARLRKHCTAAAAGRDSRLRIGTSSFFCTYVLPELLQNFRDAHPDITISFSEGNSQALAKKLLAGELDLILESEKLDHPHLQTMIWATEEIMLAVPDAFAINSELTDYGYTFEEFRIRHQIPEKPSVPLIKFANLPFLFLKAGNDIHHRSRLLCSEAGFSPSIPFFVDQMMTAYYLACEGQGVTFLRSAIADYVQPTDRIVFYRLSSTLAKRDIYLYFSKKQSSLLQESFIQYLNHTCLQHPA